MTKDNTEKKSSSPMSKDKGDFLMPPKGYDKDFASSFSELPLKWQRYLVAREEAYDKSFNDLDKRIILYKWLENIYSQLAEDLKKEGVVSQEDWLRKLIAVEQNLRSSPRETIKMLAKTYGCDFAVTNNFLPNNHHVSNPLNDVWTSKIIEKQIKDFAESKDDDGNLKHPFYSDVIFDIFRLIQNGTAKTLEEAYDMAIWLNKITRAKMISLQVSDKLQDKTKEAQKSKSASFSISGKGEPDFSKMSLRQELEHRFAKMGYIDE